VIVDGWLIADPVIFRDRRGHWPSPSSTAGRCPRLNGRPARNRPVITSGRPAGGRGEESGMVIGGGLVIVIAVIVVAIMLSKRGKP
jgi:hypothetical protein